MAANRTSNALDNSKATRSEVAVRLGEFVRGHPGGQRETCCVLAESYSSNWLQYVALKGVIVVVVILRSDNDQP